VPYIEFRQQLYPLHKGENLLGPDAGADIRLPELPAGCYLGISVESEGTFARATGNGGEISVNGRTLSDQPVPLFDGDQITVQDSALVFPLIFVDDLRPAADAERAASRPAAAAAASSVAEAEASTAAVNHERLTRVTPPQSERKFVTALRRVDNGQFHVIEGSSFRIGREKHCDLVIPDPAVSRLHAEITLSRGHYLLREHGRTPTMVNDRELHGHHKLQVGDVIRIGKYEFAFVRRPATAEDLRPAADTTPVRSAVPDAPTVMPGRPEKKKESGSRAFQLVLLALLVLMFGLILFG
jgi:pSer/pThr/pTyr-binding forkhead associated (FHA) protein